MPKTAVPDRVIDSSEVTTGSAMERTLRSALIVSVRNNAIIARIKAEEKVTSLMYSFDFSVPGEHTVEEVKVVVDVQNYLDNYENPEDVKMSKFMDLFNDNLNFDDVKRWDDIVILNSKLGKLISKLGMLRETDEANSIASKLLLNLQQINAIVKSIEFSLLDSFAQSRLGEVRNKVAQINKQTQELLASVGGSCAESFRESTILQHNAELKQFLSCVEYFASATPIYRASRDGFACEDFLKKCKEVGPTATLFLDEQGNIFGGTARTWKVPDDAEGVNLFTLVNGGGIEPSSFRFDVNQQLTNFAQKREKAFKADRCTRNNGDCGKSHYHYKSPAHPLVYIDYHKTQYTNTPTSWSWGNALVCLGDSVQINFPAGGFIDTTGEGAAAFGGSGVHKLKEIEVFELHE